MIKQRSEWTSNEKQENEKEQPAPWTQLTLRLQRTLNSILILFVNETTDAVTQINHLLFSKQVNWKEGAIEAY